MAPFARVLIATDFSAGAGLALRRAAQLPLARHAVVTIVHVLPDRTGPLRAATVRRAATQGLQEAVRRFRQRLRGQRGIVVQRVLLRGKPFQAVLRHARHPRCDLIVVGARGYRRPTLREALLGSTAERVIRGASQPVLVVHGRGGPYQRPLVALDVASGSRTALELAIQLAGPKSRLHAVHICEAPLQGVLLRAGPPRLVGEYRRECVADARSHLGKLVAGSALPVALTVRVGDPRRGILGVAEQIRADLIALGRGSSRLQQIVLGSVSEAVARYATCDVLVGGRR